MKNNNLKLIFLLGLFVSSMFVSAQDKLSFNGYISTMGQSNIIGDSTSWDATVHNRLNLTYYANDNFTFHLEARNQFRWGQTIENTPGYAETFAEDKGWLNMNFNWFENNNNFINTQVDRAFVEYVKGNFEMSIGRQRVNWGRSLVWNPNDLFNAFSYYDFDYEERPGSDAFRMQYYTGTASSVEMVAKIDSGNNATVAALTKINKWGYDLQFLAGYANSEDLVVGAGWEGNIRALAFRGEMTYYHPEQNFSDTSGSFLACISFDYLLPQNITTQFEFLYNDAKNTIDITDPTALFAAPSTSKSLSFSEYNFFANLSWQVIPILTINAAGMYYPDYNGFYLMPSIDASLSDNMYFSLMYQHMNLEIYHTRLASHSFFARLKWNF